MEESLYVPDEGAAPCSPELALRGAVVLVKGLLHTGLWCMRGSLSFASFQIDFCHFKLLFSPLDKGSFFFISDGSSKLFFKKNPQHDGLFF